MQQSLEITDGQDTPDLGGADVDEDGQSWQDLVKFYANPANWRKDKPGWMDPEHVILA